MGCCCCYKNLTLKEKDRLLDQRIEQVYHQIRIHKTIQRFLANHKNDQTLNNKNDKIKSI